MHKGKYIDYTKALKELELIEDKKERQEMLKYYAIPLLRNVPKETLLTLQNNNRFMDIEYHILVPAL